jgi:hypothetical protein
MTLEDFEKILNQEKELKEKWPAHPNGLFLAQVIFMGRVLLLCLNTESFGSSNNTIHFAF